MKLFHFTSYEYLPSILAVGLDTGEIPLNPSEAVNAVCLTEIDSAGLVAQRWTRLNPRKLLFRLTVGIVPNDPRLLKWKYFPDKLKMERHFWKLLTRCGGGDAYKWWVYFGVIPPSQIIEIFDTREQKRLSDAEIQAIRHEPQLRGISISGVRLITYEEALRVAPSSAKLPTARSD